MLHVFLLLCYEFMKICLLSDNYIIRPILPFLFKVTPTTEIYTLSLHDALPICPAATVTSSNRLPSTFRKRRLPPTAVMRSEEHTSELQSHSDLVCRLLLEKKKNGIVNKNRYSTELETQCSSHSLHVALNGLRVA